MNEYNEYKLSNGIRLIHKPVSTNVAYCGLLINTGSRDETEAEHGMAHFTEHVIFKGTTKRKYYHILNRMEDIGGELDAYTTKEETFITATFLNEYYERAIELLSDIIFNSTYPDKEIAKEKQVILDEINSYKDNPSELIFDDFEDMIFKNHSIGRNILGTKKHLKSFNKEKVQQFVAANYNTDQMVFCSVGNIDIKKLIRLFEKHFGKIPQNNRTIKRIAYKDYSKEDKIINKRTYQAHCIIGNIAYDYYNSKRVVLDLINNILGGPGMNSTFNVELRERHGLVYNVESSFNKYTDTGLWTVYFGTDKTNLDKSIELIHKELNKFKTKGIGIQQLHKAKQQIKGQIAISADNNSSLFYTIAKSYMLYGKIDSLNTISKIIEAITPQQILEVSNEIFDLDKMTMLIYK